LASATLRLYCLHHRSAHKAADQLPSGDHTKDVVSNLAVMVAGNVTLLRTAEEQGVSPELLTPYLALMACHLADGHGTREQCSRPIENVRGLLTSSATSPDEVEPCPWCLGDTSIQPAMRALGAVMQTPRLW
jgi:hypothetical protein